eukprot:1619165-Pyramimonas_sp.AAC.1
MPQPVSCPSGFVKQQVRWASEGILGYPRLEKHRPCDPCPSPPQHGSDRRDAARRAENRTSIFLAGRLAKEA